MAENTKIEWADHTFNPWIGCTKVGPGCDNCYAEADFDKRRHVVQWGAGNPRKRTTVANWRNPIKWNAEAARLGVRYRVFCASLADVFDNEVPDSWRADLFALIGATPHIDWLLVTKRIGNVSRMVHEAAKTTLCLNRPHSSSLPNNVWLGATITNQEEADRDIPKLLATPAAVRFLSMEPLLGPVELNGHDYAVAAGLTEGIDWLTGKTSQSSSIFGGDAMPWLDRDIYDFPENADEPRINWVIVGGESGPNARPMHPEWARSIRDQCETAGVPFLFKQWGEWAPRSGALTGGGTDFSELDPSCTRWPQVTRLGENGLDTRVCENCTPDAGQDVYMQRVGKKLAGRVLDATTHDGFPNTAPTEAFK